METQNNDKKQIVINFNTHQQLKMLAVETSRNINCDLADDLLLLGIEEFRRVKKNFAPCVTCTGNKGESEVR